MLLWGLSPQSVTAHLLRAETVEELATTPVPMDDPAEIDAMIARWTE